MLKCLFIPRCKMIIIPHETDRIIRAQWDGIKPRLKTSGYDVAEIPKEDYEEYAKAVEAIDSGKEASFETDSTGEEV